jgi:hypothetical protein
MPNQTAPVSTSPKPAAGATSKGLGPRGTIFIMVFVLVVTLGIPFFLIWLPDMQKNKLLETGVPAEAKILSIEPTGTIYNDQYEYRIRMEVYPESAPTFQAETKEVINAIYAPQFQPGNYLLVKYDPEDPSKVAIEETLGPRDE